jgi:hypothetical protein
VTVKFKKGLEIGLGLGLEDPNERPGCSVDQRISSGLRSRLIGYQVRVIRFRYGCGPEPVPGAEYLNPRPDG